MRQLCNLIILLLCCFNAVASSRNINPEHFLSADTITYDSMMKYINAKGHVIVMAEGYIVTADNMFYDINKDELWAQGNVRVKSDQKGKNYFQMDGDSVLFKNKFKEGVIKYFVLYFGDNSLLAASLAKRIDEKHSSLLKAQYTACKICGKNPMWSVSAAKSNIDLEKEKVSYHNAFFNIYGVPVFYVPYFVHPTPKAKAQSGLLMPNYNKSGLGVPIYYRPKENLDITFTPRLKNREVLMEADIRYLTNQGTYNINSSFTNTKLVKKSDSGVIKDNRLNRYYVNFDGDVKEKEFNYKVRLNRTSDSAYLKQFYNKNDSYLKSYLYADKVDKVNFVSVESLYFQDLRQDNITNVDAFVLPEIRVKHVMPILNDDTFITIANNNMNYVEGSNYKVSRNALSTSLTHILKTDNGHLFNISGYNRFDWYHVDVMRSNSNPQNKTKVRAIPEMHLGWQYPLIKTYLNNNVTILEPEVLFVASRDKSEQNIKFAYVDSGSYNLTEENLFNTNHYNGVDFHEYGNRASYGLKSSHNTTSGYVFNAFLGRLKRFNSMDGLDNQANLLTRASVNYQNRVELYYNSRVNSLVRSPFREEIGAWYNNQIIYLNVGLIKIKPVQFLLYPNKQVVTNAGIRQIYFDTKYQFNENWSVGTDARFNLVAYDKISAISRNIKMTYEGDCVKIALRFGRNYTADPSRGIYKTNDNEFAISLKTLGSF